MTRWDSNDDPTRLKEWNVDDFFLERREEIVITTVVEMMN
jgi:hypothetical protein